MPLTPKGTSQILAGIGVGMDNGKIGCAGTKPVISLKRGKIGFKVTINSLYRFQFRLNIHVRTATQLLNCVTQGRILHNFRVFCQCTGIG